MLPLTRSRNRSRFFGAPFSPASLFAGGTVAGAWYDPSDLSTLFTTSAGTTQCAMPGLGSAVSVGLMLDKSQGLVLGPELVTNGDFSGGTTGWSSFASVGTSSIAVVSGELQATTSVSQGASGARQVLTGLTSGRWYKVVGTVRVINNQGVADVAATIRWANGNVTTGYSTLVSSTSISPTQISGYFLAGNSTVTLFLVNGGSGLTPSSYVTGYDNISVKELPGNHAIAFNDTTARPELRARVNLLTYSEEFGNALWVKNNTTVSAVKVIDPLGGITAQQLYETATTGVHGVNQAVDLALGVSFVSSCYVKANGRNFAWISVTGGAARLAVAVDLTTGQLSSVVDTFGNYAGITVSATDVGNGWWRLGLTARRAAGGADPGSVDVGISDSLTPRPSYAGDVTKGIFIWGADLRPANIGANVPAYQRIADANTYDTSGFPLYLRFDGVDDSMYTPANLNLSGTDKVSVFAGVTKNSDAAQGVVTELSATIASNNGTFLLTAPNSAAANYNFSSKGTVRSDNTVSAYAAPITSVVTAAADITAASNVVRVNSVQVGSNANTQGTGNYGNYPIFIGSRNQASLRFNGNIYSLIIAGASYTDAQISSTEQWVSGKTGIPIVLPSDYNFLTTATGDQLTTAAGDPLYTTPIYP